MKEVQRTQSMHKTPSVLFYCNHASSRLRPSVIIYLALMTVIQISPVKILAYKQHSDNNY